MKGCLDLLLVVNERLERIMVTHVQETIVKNSRTCTRVSEQSHMRSRCVTCRFSIITVAMAWGTGALFLHWCSWVGFGISTVVRSAVFGLVCHSSGYHWLHG